MMIVHIITGLATGGAERALYNILIGGLAKEMDCHVISLSDDGFYGRRIRDAGVPVFSLGMRRGRPSFEAAIQLCNLVKKIRPTVIQGWMYHGNLAASVAQHVAPGAPALAWNIRQTLYGLADERWLTRQVIRIGKLVSQRPDALIYNSHLSRDQHEAYGYFGGSASVIPNGFDLQTFCSSEFARSTHRNSLGIPASAQVVGHVARFHPMKDHLGFLRSAVRLAEMNQDVHIVLSGLGIDERNQALLNMVPSPLRPRFHWLGQRDDVHELMRAFDVLALSSAWGEAFPNVLGEAMATGLPCVATNVGDCAQIIGETGFIVPPRDDDGLVAALEKILHMTGEQRMRLGRAARTRIEENYSLDSVVGSYIDLYDGLS